MPEYKDNPYHTQTTSEVINEIKKRAITLQLIGGAVNSRVPVFSFIELGVTDQIDIAKQLALSTLKDGKRLIYDIGFGTTKSPIDIAGTFKNTTVLGFDPQGIFNERFRIGTENINIPTIQSKSIAALFGLTLQQLVKNEFPSANRLQSIAPYPNMTIKIITSGCLISDELYVILNPNNSEKYPPKNILKMLPTNISAELSEMTPSEIENI
jgi:hypothetical protein